METKTESKDTKTTLDKGGNVDELLGEVFVQCKKALLHLRDHPQDMQKPPCFDKDTRFFVTKSEEGLLIEGWTKTRQWHYIQYMLKTDDTETKYMDGVIA